MVVLFFTKASFFAYLRIARLVSQNLAIARFHGFLPFSLRTWLSRDLVTHDRTSSGGAAPCVLLRKKFFTYLRFPMKKLLLLICLSALLSYQVNAQSISWGLSSEIITIAVVVIVAVAVLIVTFVVVVIQAFKDTRKNPKRREKQALLKRILMQKLLV